MDLLFAILTGLICLALGYLLAQLRGKQQQQNVALSAQENHQLKSRLEEVRQQFNNAQQQAMQAGQSLAEHKSDLKNLHAQLAEQQNRFDSLNDDFHEVSGRSTQLEKLLATEEAQRKAMAEDAKRQQLREESLGQQLNALQQKNENLMEALKTQEANNRGLQEKLQQQKGEIEDLHRKFKTEFELVAQKILEEKTARFTDHNKEQLAQILQPLGQNIDKFQARVNEVYDKEAKERFSLAEKVRELAALNHKISTEAHNLTKALKGEVKTQGRWGEIILERILEQSGLRKGTEYFMEQELKDEQGKHLRSDIEDKKMRPDAVIHYPDERHVIIDSKVSLNAYTRHIEAEEDRIKIQELDAHVQAIKNHITALSSKGYDDYNKALDFVIMFVPNEAAYIAAIKHEPQLWEYAYERRIMLMNPTNLITSLKLINDLWKREYQNKNAQEIAEQGAKLYDKFVLFTENLEKVGSSIQRAQEQYDTAYKQLSTGNNNLVKQTQKLKSLGLKTKKELQPGLLDQH
ncbi:DNA recombination protein RmuC [Persicobacter psychrovividus]|uniref:DNA recombination protein RmuC n=1 Tax=Persicobacter psychrovividus TaxID=387638 RepID=A0ABM7VJ05_9BACT|nr:DNA recombination protein RmuC [Persicobacter psychrovividus]